MQELVRCRDGFGVSQFLILYIVDVNPAQVIATKDGCRAFGRFAAFVKLSLVLQLWLTRVEQLPTFVSQLKLVNHRLHCTIGLVPARHCGIVELWAIGEPSPGHATNHHQADQC